MQRNYHAYLLRIWNAGLAEAPSWRASLEDPHTRRVLSFTSLDSLNDYLSELKFLSEHRETDHESPVNDKEIHK